MNVKAVVKVMNFHALLRVDASRRRAEKYEAMKDELESMMQIILNNRNLRLDKHIRLPDPSLPVLRIYIGSDFGFCGGVNTAVSNAMQREDGAKVVVGKRLRKHGEVSLYLPQEEFTARFDEVQKYLEIAVRTRRWSAVELVYNYYSNLSTVKLVHQRIYPLDLAEERQEDALADFMFEGDAERILENMMISYLVYELRIAAASAYASENVMRQNATSESLKKLDEAEAEAFRLHRKEVSQKSAQKTTDDYIKRKFIEGM